jgi:hypothetical protein
MSVLIPFFPLLLKAHPSAVAFTKNTKMGHPLSNFPLMKMLRIDDRELMRLNGLFSNAKTPRFQPTVWPF